MPTQILFEPLFPGVEPPTRATYGSAGYDLKAYLLKRDVRVRHPNNDEWVVDGTPGLTLHPGDRAIIPAGFRATLPDGYEAQIRPRSGQTFKVGLTVANSPGTVDQDYPEEWGVIVRNDSSVPLVVAHGERIAQLVLAKYHVIPWFEGKVRLSGIGSTGT